MLRPMRITRITFRFGFKGKTNGVLYPPSALSLSAGRPAGQTCSLGHDATARPTPRPFSASKPLGGQVSGQAIWPK